MVFFNDCQVSRHFSLLYFSLFYCKRIYLWLTNNNENGYVIPTMLLLYCNSSDKNIRRFKKTANGTVTANSCHI